MSKRSRKQKKNSENYGTLRVFPEEIVLNILSRLPFDTIFNCKLVSKYWQTLIALPSFAHMHLSFHRKLLRLDDDDNPAAAAAVNGGNVSLGILFSIHFTNYDKFKYGAYYGDYYEDKPFSYTSKSMSLLNHPQLNNNKSQSYEIVGSCNGLVCYYVPFTEKRAFYVCNPMTKEYVYYLVDDKRHYWGEDNPKYISGFGYVQSSNEYKIVRINTDGGKIQVFTLGTDRRGWRDKGEIKGKWLQPYYISKVGMLANGALHWLDYATMKIMAFDLAKEEFDQVQSPPCFLPPGYVEKNDHFQLRVLGRFLCIVHLKLGNGVDIWSLKKIDQCWSWNKEFSIPANQWDWNMYDLFALTNCGKLLLLKRHSFPCGSAFHVKLCSYDSHTATITPLVEDNQVGAMLEFEAIPHINSFISLKALGIENCKQRKKYQRKKYQRKVGH
ncbi:hypothetical protein ACHQM5_014769 [Ranunculus cassubicifolius]